MEDAPSLCRYLLPTISIKEIATCVKRRVKRIRQMVEPISAKQIDFILYFYYKKMRIYLHNTIYTTTFALNKQSL